MTRFRPLIQGMAAVAVCLVIGNGAAAQDAAAIMKKMEGAIKSAKTVAVQLEMKMDGGQMGSMGTLMDVKLVPGKKSYLSMKPNGTPTGMMAQGAAAMSMQIVDDGTNMFAYNAARKTYSKLPSQASKQNVMGTITMGAGQIPGAAYKKLSDKVIDGKPHHAIQMTPPSGGNPMMANMTLMIYVDKSTNLARLITTEMKMPQGPQGQGGSMKNTVNIRSWALNKPIPDSVFKFSPPPGSKEMQGGMMGGMMGGPPPSNPIRR